MIILDNVTSNARFLLYSLLLFTFPLTTVGLIVLPKVLTVRRMTQRANTDESDGPEDSSDRRMHANNPPTPSSTRDGETSAVNARDVPRSPRIQVVTFD